MNDVIDEIASHMEIAGSPNQVIAGNVPQGFLPSHKAKLVERKSCCHRWTDPQIKQRTENKLKVVKSAYFF
jgi:hypothetical protein